MFIFSEKENLQETECANPIIESLEYIQNIHTNNPYKKYVIALKKIFHYFTFDLFNIIITN